VARRRDSACGAQHEHSRLAAMLAMLAMLEMVGDGDGRRGRRRGEEDKEIIKNGNQDHGQWCQSQC
jgi:hypothetical protein